MEANKILHSDLLDIVFENRNKDYGAYELRRQYNSHMSVALLVMSGIALIVFLSSFFQKPAVEKVKPKVNVVDLTNVVLPPMEEKTVEPPKPKQQKPVKTEQFVTMRVEPDNKVNDKAKPPTQDELDNAVIGTQDQEGEKPLGNEGGSEKVEGSSKVEQPEPKTPEIFERTEIDAAFPGGMQAWFKYISKEINRNMDELQDDGKSGTVVVQFVVDTEGNVSDVKILGCNETGVSNCLGNNTKLAEIALAAIKRGPKWTPAVQNGVQVKAYRRQPITFRLSEE